MTANPLQSFICNFYQAKNISHIVLAIEISQVTVREICFDDVSLLPLFPDGNSVHIVAPERAELEHLAEDAFSVMARLDSSTMSSST